MRRPARQDDPGRGPRQGHRPATGRDHLRAAVYEESNLVPASDIEARSDEQGRYQVDGLPRASPYRLFVEPNGGEPYLKATLRVAAETPSVEPVDFDVKLSRGVVIRGRVTDRVTGRPVRASIDVYAFEDNPHAREFPGYWLGGSARVFSDLDGRFEALAVPGRGLVGVLVGGYLVPYRVAPNARAIRGFDPGFGGFRTVPSFCHAESYDALAEIDLDPKAGSATMNIQVDPGRMLKLIPVDPEGSPVPGTKAMGVEDLPPTSNSPQESPTFEILALDPSRPRRVTVTHPGRDLVGSVYLKGDEIGPPSLPLRPAGTITGRVYGDGRPRGGLGFGSTGGTQPARPAEQGVLPGGDVVGGIRVGRDGRFRIGGLVPGLKYGGGEGEGMQYHGELFRDVIVAPGEVKDLGDLKPSRPERARKLGRIPGRASNGSSWNPPANSPRSGRAPPTASNRASPFIYPVWHRPELRTHDHPAWTRPRGRAKTSCPWSSSTRSSSGIPSPPRGERRGSRRTSGLSASRIGPGAQT